MRIDVVGLHGLGVTDAIREYAEAKSEKLLNHFSDLVQSIMYRIEMEDAHAERLFKVELTVAARQHDEFVANASGGDLYLAIDASVNKADRQLGDFKQKQKQSRR